MIKTNKIKSALLTIVLFTTASFTAQAQEIFTKPDGAQTRWVSPENPTGEKGGGGKVNKGAKGNAYFIVAPGEKKTLFDVKGAGIIERIWMSGTIAINAEQRRAVRLDMFWDGASKPAVSAPLGDFFGVGLGLLAPFQSALFASPEARSYNCTIPMPYKKSAKIEITNESSTYVFIWYDVDYLQLKKVDENAMYFHAYWSRNPKTTLGDDFQILPEVNGTGRYLGSNIGIIGNPAFIGTWFGEGEVKMYLDDDKKLPTLVGTGTEDYIGSGWGQGIYYGPYHGALITDKTNDIYAFYRYHTSDHVYFYKNCKVTIQQMGSASVARILDMQNHHINMKPLDIIDTKDEGLPYVKKLDPNPHTRLLDQTTPVDLTSKQISGNAVLNFYRGDDDVSATAYFYLDKPESNLPALPPVELRMRDMKKVFDKEIK